MNPVQLSAIDTNLLVILDPLLHTQSVSQAARSLGMSPSATSHALARLRDLLGDELLVRAGRGLVLTPRGAQLAPLVAHAVAALQHVLQPAQDFKPAKLRRTFHLLYASYFDWVLVPALDRALRQQAPQVKLHTRSGRVSTVTSLRDGSTDLAFMPPMDLPPDMHTRPFLRDHFVSLVRVGHPCLQQAMTLERFANLEHVLVSPSGGTEGGVVDTMLAEHGLSRRVVRTFTNFLPAPYLVVQSDYVLTLPRCVAHMASTLFDFELIDVPESPPHIELYLVWHQRNHHDPAHRWFRELLVTVMDNVWTGMDTPDSPSRLSSSPASS